MSAPKIAILGWGSLLWDKHETFDKCHGSWESAGPELRIEFSRVSTTRGGALTLVIDQANGASCRVSYALSTRRDPEDAICDVRSREGTTRNNIGFYFADGSQVQSRDPAALEAIKAWAPTHGLDVVVWADLNSNFEKATSKPFSVENAIAHLSTLGGEAKARAAEYVWRAPAFVQTPLRKALEVVPWFKP